MNWGIEYFSKKVEKSILSLSEELLARYVRLTDLMLEFCPNLGMPHTRSLNNSLFELRVNGKKGIARVFYCTRIGKRIIILHVFIKKSQRIPKNELNIAFKRMKEVIKNDS